MSWFEFWKIGQISNGIWNLEALPFEYQTKWMLFWMLIAPYLHNGNDMAAMRVPSKYCIGENDPVFKWWYEKWRNNVCLWPKMFSTWMVCLIIWPDHFKTEQKNCPKSWMFKFYSFAHIVLQLSSYLIV